MEKGQTQLENRLLQNLDGIARVMMPISGDAILINHAKNYIRKHPDEKIMTTFQYTAAITLKYFAWTYAFGLHNYLDGLMN